MGLRERIVKALPPLARRDARIAELRARAAELRDDVRAGRAELRRSERTVSRQAASLAELDATRTALESEVERREVAARTMVDVDAYLGEPSFRRQLLTLRRTTKELRDLDPRYRHPLRQIPYKLRNYQLAASHGVRIPTVYASWMRAEEIVVAELPDAFVIKSDGGAASRGVLPLRREGEDRYVTVDGRSAFTEEEIRAHFVRLKQERRVMQPYFAEELLIQPGGGGVVPDDVKVYACYGEVQQVLLRRVTEHGVRGVHTRRYVRPDGTDLGAVVAGMSLDETIPVPQSLPQIVQIAEHLSRAVGVPFVRVDVYDTDGGLVLGEITRAPGGDQRIRADHDRAMGQAWERAVYRLDLDLLAGRPPGLLHGDRPVPQLYPAGHVSRSARPGAWVPVVADCQSWCRPAG